MTTHHAPQHRPQRRWLRTVILCAGAAAAMWPSWPRAHAADAASAVVPPSDTAIRASVAEAYGRLPLAFEENRGQAPADVRFVVRVGGYSLSLTSQEAVLSLPAIGAAGGPPAAVRLTLVGANQAPRARGTRLLPGVAHYVLGDDPRQWHTAIRRFAAVEYEEVYPGIDLIFHGDRGQIEYDFVVAPGANPGDIALAFTGADRVRLDEHGDLLVSRGRAEIRQRRPVIYQDVDGERVGVDGGYRLDGARVAFDVGRYDRHRPLVIDPVLAYSTTLGGRYGDSARAVAVDKRGHAYVAGVSYSYDFPGVPCPTSERCDGGGTFVAKLSPDGMALVYLLRLQLSTAIPGAIAVDADGQAYVTGVTDGSGYIPTTPGAFQRLSDGQYGVHGFVMKLDAGGLVVFSTYLAGSSIDKATGLAVDEQGRVSVSGWTSSVDFPLTPDARQPTRLGEQDGFVTVFAADGGSLVYSTYLGGTRQDVINATALDAEGQLYVVGQTNSPDLPTTFGALRRRLEGPSDAFVARFDLARLRMEYATYLGGRGGEAATAAALDRHGDIHVAGWTRSPDFPATPRAFQGALAGAQDAFVARLTHGGTAVVYATLLGGTRGNTASAIAVDAAGRTIVTGFTSSPDFPTRGSAQPFYGQDVFVLALSPRGRALLSSTFLGGGLADVSYGVAVDATGAAYVVGYTASAGGPEGPAFPTTADGRPVACPTCYGGSDVFVTKIDMRFLHAADAVD